MENQKTLQENTDKTEELQKKPRGKHLFKKGQSGNPKGRPKGSISIKDKVRQYLENNPKDVEKIVKHFVKENRELMWQMLEGKPKQQMEVDVDKDTLGEL